MAVRFPLSSDPYATSLLPTFVRSGEAASPDEPSMFKSAFQVAQLFVSSLFEPFTDLYESGAVGKAISTQVERLSTVEGIIETSTSVAHAIKEHPLDAISFGQVALFAFSPDAAAYLSTVINAAKCYNMAGLTEKDLKNVLSSSMTGKVVLLIGLASLPVAIAAQSCSYPNLYEALLDPSANASCNPNLTMSDISDATKHCMDGNNLKSCEMAIPHAYLCHPTSEGFSPVSTIGVCPDDQMCFLVAPGSDMLPIEICFDRIGREIDILSVSIEEHSSPSQAFNGTELIGTGNGLFYAKIQGCLIPQPPMQIPPFRSKGAACMLVPYTEEPGGSIDFCVNPKDPVAHTVSFSRETLLEKLLKGSAEQAQDESIM